MQSRVWMQPNEGASMKSFESRASYQSAIDPEVSESRSVLAMHA